MDVSIVIPTFNESENVPVLVERIRQALEDTRYSYEMWFIDDSRDHTPEVLEELSIRYPQVHYVHRENGSGLGTAVVEGFNRSSGKCLVVMDADLQHPPEILPRIVDSLASGVEVVIPSRFVEGGADAGLGPFRKFVSWTARTIGRVSIKRLRDISDCTGGYFGIHRTVIEGADLDPVGWKILMEVLVKGNYETVHEVPYSFVTRNAGESKMSMREQWNYIVHIAKLVRSSPEDRRFYMFCFVGALGVVVNLLAMTVLMHAFHVHPVAASIIASLIAMAHNFLWNDRVTWRGHSNPIFWRRVLRFPLFVAVSAVGVAVTAVLVRLAVWIHVNEVLGQLLGIIVATGWGYLANNHWTWGKDTSRGNKVKVTQEV